MAIGMSVVQTRRLRELDARNSSIQKFAHARTSDPIVNAEYQVSAESEFRVHGSLLHFVEFGA